MQTIIGTMALILVATAMLIQAMWMFVSRHGRDRYLRDLGNFRRPRSIWSQYYKWRVDSTRNTIIDGIGFLIILVSLSSILVFSLLELYEVPSMVLILLFIITLSSISVVQNTVKIRGLKERELEIINKVENATDKIATARAIATGLISAGKSADGRVWFAFYRVGQQQDPVGWAIRDVLLDPELTNYQEGSISPSSLDMSSSDSEGPGIN